MNIAATNKRERSLGELVIVVLVFSIMMAIFIFYFFKNEDHITEVGFTHLANNFYGQVVLFHSQWFMDGRPKHIITVEIDQITGKKEKRLIALNQWGWVDSDKNTLACKKIWHAVMDMPLRYAKKVVSAVEIKRHTKKIVPNIKTTRINQGRICRFTLQSGQFLEYHTINGQVNSANQLN